MNWRLNKLHRSFHVEVDTEAASFVDTIWVYTYITVVRLSNLLGNGEAEAETLTIHLSCSLQFSEACEDFAEIWWVDSDPSILNANT